MGRLAPAKTSEVTRTREFHPCDRCGVSVIDGGHIAQAKYEVQVPGGGKLYLCGSHFRRHWPHIFEHQYEVVSLEPADA